MAIALVQNGGLKNIGATGSTSGTFSFSSAVTTGNTVIVWVFNWASPTGSLSVSDGTNTYTQIVSQTNNNSAFQIFYASNVTGGSLSIAVSDCNGVGGSGAAFAEFSGVSSLTDGSSNGGTFTPTTNGALVLVGATDNYSGTIYNSNSPYSDIVFSFNIGNFGSGTISVAAGYLIQTTAAASQNYTNNNFNQAVGGFALKAATSAAKHELSLLGAGL